MEEGNFDVIEEQGGCVGEEGTEGEGVGGAKVHCRQQQRELVGDVLQLEKPQPHFREWNACVGN